MGHAILGSEGARRRRRSMVVVLTSFALLVMAGAPSQAAAPASPGELYAFGANFFGQLGNTTNNGTENANPTPTIVTFPGAAGPVTQIAAGNGQSLAVTSTGQLYAFGENKYGQLGSTTNNGTSNANPTPTLVTLPGATGPVTQIAVCAYHSLAVTSTGQLYAFGENREGQLGSTTNNGTSNANPTPALVTPPGASGPVTQIAAGNDHSLAVTSTGQLYALGENRYGQLGSTTSNGTVNANPTPALVGLGAGTTVDTAARGAVASHTLVLVADLAVTSGSLPAGQVGAFYSVSAQASGGTRPYAWSASGLPAGLAINPASGQIAGTPTSPGSAGVVLSVTDAYGISAISAVIPLTVAPAPTRTTTTTQPPTLTSASLTNRRFRVAKRDTAMSAKRAPLGTTFRVTLSAAAKLQITITRSAPGLRRGRSCLAPTTKLRRKHAKHCTRTLTVGTLTRSNEPRGVDSVAFSGRIGHRALPPGACNAILSASNASGRSKAVRLAFVVVR
jgi:hypothetical protein